MRVSEADAALAVTTAKVLGVELEPWQEQVLQWLLADHRQKPADTDRKLITQVEMFGECGALSNPMCLDDGADVRLRCRLGADHTGRPHEGLIPGHRQATSWFDGGGAL